MTMPPRPRLDVRGAVDLSALGRPATPPPGAAQAADGPVVDLTEATFAAVVQQSLTVPVIVVLWTTWSEVSQQVTRDLVALAGEAAGRFLLARVDADAEPKIAQAFGAQTVPAVLAVLKGQPVPLFQGAAGQAEMRPMIVQVLEAAAANGVTGTVPVGDVEPAERTEAAEPPLPPLHQAAFDAIERDDLVGAAAAYQQALTENPRDEMARAGLAQVGLLTRVHPLDPAAVRAAAQADPTELDAHLAVADLELLAGEVQAAFDRLIALVKVTAGPQREQARLRLVDLFTVVGPADPLVLAARRQLASALY